MTEQKDFQVALLIDDLNEVKRVSEAFREIGIYAHFYNNLGEFWIDTKTRTPDLTIIDVKKMSDGEMLFQNHPLVKKEKLCFAFYYKEETKMLLNSTYNLNHYGFVKKEISLAGQIQTILRARNKELRLIEQNIELANKVSRTEKRTVKLSQMAQETSMFEDNSTLMNEFFETVGMPKKSKSLIKNLSHSLNSWEHCYSFGIYKLSKNGQKLISTDKVGPKFKKLPDLWLNNPCKEGIKDYALDMACDISRDYLLNAIRPIEIKGMHNSGDYLLLANFDESRLRMMDWNLFSDRISSLYRYTLISEIKEVEFNKEISSAEALSLLDDMHFHQAGENYKFLHLDLSNLLKLTQSKHSNRFYWKPFIEDLKSELSNSLNGKYRFSFYGTQSVLLFIDKQHLDGDFQILKHLVEDFPFFKYFEDSSLLFTKDNRPNLSTLAPSSANFHRRLETKQAISNAGRRKAQINKSGESNRIFNI